MKDKFKKAKEWLTDFFSERKHRYMVIFGFLAFVFILILIIVVLAVTKRYSYTRIEEMMVDRTKEYFSTHKELRPTKEQPIFELDSTSLVAEKLLKDFSKLSNDTNCHGKVLVTYNHGALRYTPTLTCDGYQTKTLKETILEAEDLVTEGDGLYQLETVYRFKGDYVNNYFSFANKTWRLFKMTEDGMLYFVLADTVNDKNSAAIFDDRYNEDAKGDKGYNDYDTSRIKVTLDHIYTEEFQNYKAYLLDYEACKNTRSEIDTDMTGAIECNTTTTTPLTLMAVYDYLSASRDPLCINTMMPNCMNYNYLVGTKNRWWLLNGTNEVSYKVYYANHNGDLLLDYANGKKNLRYVIALSDEVLYKSGTGTSNDPYTIYQY